MTDQRQDPFADRIYRELLRSIISGEYGAGVRLKEREISERFEVSRIPVREALHRLEAEGFVDAAPHRGVTVSPVTRADIEDLFDLRLCIEPFAAGKAAERVARGDADPARLADLLIDARVADPLRARLASLDFHDEVVRLSGNTRLARSLAPIRGRMEWIFRLTPSERNAEHAAEHAQICEAISTGRSAAAAALTYAHIDLGRAPILSALDPHLAN